MTNEKPSPQSGNESGKQDHQDKQDELIASAEFSRRDLLASAATGAALGAITAAGLSGVAAPSVALAQGAQQRILLKGGVVLTMDPNGQDYEQADVLIQGSKIAAIGPNLAAGGQVIDARGKIVMPGFIDTHNHHFYTIQRNIISDGNLSYAGMSFPWPQERYSTVAGNIWSTGRIGSAANPTWDIMRSPYAPEDNYISHLVHSVNQINAGVTTGVDTSQNSNTPEHSDAMIRGLMDSGRRAVYVYSGGTNRSAQDPNQPYEFPGAIGNVTSGLGRLKTQFFNSNDQLVTLAHSGGPRAGWELARAFDVPIVNHHGQTDGSALVNNADLLELLANEGRSVEVIHGARFTDAAFNVAAQYGVKFSLAASIEMQMGHGLPPFQLCLDRGILPSLSSDVETNMTADMFTIMRSAFTIQRALIHQRALPVSSRGGGETNLPPLLTCYQVLQMATMAGAAAVGLENKVGMLKVGMEADVIMLNARTLNVWPMNNAPGAVVTMMDTSNVDTVIIGGTIKKLRGQLLGVNVENLLREVERSRERVLARINGPAVGSNPGIIHQGLNSLGNPYRPNFLRSCCAGGPDNIGEYDATP